MENTATLLPGNIVFGGESILKACYNYDSFGNYLMDKLLELGDQVVLVNAAKSEEFKANYLYKESVRLAQIMKKLGVQAGDVVCISSENRVEFAVVLFASLILNATFAPINITYTKREVEHALNLSKPKMVVASNATIDLIAEVASRTNFVKTIISIDNTKLASKSHIHNYQELRKNQQKYPSKPTFRAEPARDKDNDVSIIVCSSGTTGMPKGVQLTQANIMFNVDTTMESTMLPLNVTMLTVIPWFHAFGCFTLILTILRGSTLIFLSKFEEKLFLETIQKYKVMVAYMVPPLMVFLAKHPLVAKYDLSSLVLLFCGAAPLSKETVDQVKARIGVPVIRQGYGLSESTLSVLVQNENACSPGSVGALKAGTYAKVIDPDTGAILGPNQRGELCFKGACIMKGYIGDVSSTESTIKDGWLHTGDIGYFTEDLEFFIVDRIKELIKYKAFQVPPAEIEALLLQHPAISDAAVIGKPDEEAGELPMAFVVKQTGSKLTEKEIEQFVRERSSPAKYLRGGVVFVQEIPKNPSGKILRRVLRDMLKQQTLKSKL